VPAKIKIYIKGLSDVELLALAVSVFTALSVHLAYRDPPALAPSLAHLKETTDLFQQLYNEARNGDRVKIALRNGARAELEKILYAIIRYLEMLGANNPNMLLDTGFERRQATSTSFNGTMHPPTNVTVRQGERRGTMIGRANRVPGAGSYELHIAQADPSVEANWKHFGVSLHCSNMIMDNLDLGQAYFLRVRGIFSSGPGPWSSPTDFIAT